MPPVAQKVPKVDVVHGDRREDDYAWLRDKQDPAVKAYLEDENLWADAIMRPTEGLQASLYKEMLSHIKETDVNVPYRKKGFFYYSRTEEGKQYPIYCRKKGSLDAPEQVTLDLNALAEKEKFMALGASTVSDDGRLLAYTTDTTGFRQYTLYVKDLETGELVEKVAEKVGSVAWAADNKTLFYTVEEESTKRQYRLFRHALGTERHDLVFEEQDDAFNVGVGRTRSEAYLIFGMGSLTTSEVRFLPAAEPSGEWRQVAPRIAKQEYDVEHHGESFYIRTNDQGRNFRLVKAPVANPGREHWQEVLPHRPDVMLEGMDFFKDFSVLYEREGGLPQGRVTDLRTGDWHRITFPEPAYSAFPGANPEFDTKVFRYNYQSLVTPNSVFDYDMERRTSTLLKQQEVPGGYDASQYASERFFATAKDGVKVPISLVYKKGFKRDGRAPLYLAAYGSYGFPYPVIFSSNRLALLDRGFVAAIAHIRGGGDMGKPWHDDGRMLKKMNTFTDFIDCAEHLVQAGYAKRDGLHAWGGSAGGLLMGAVANMRPDLWKSVLADVPFVDVMTTMLDPDIPLTTGEYDEWGNPNDKAFYDYMKSYSPYDNVRAQDYPALLVTTGLADSQVQYFEPAKWVAKLRATKTGDSPLLLRCEMDSGHGGAAARTKAYQETAFEYAFLLDAVGIKQ